MAQKIKADAGQIAAVRKNLKSWEKKALLALDKGPFQDYAAAMAEVRVNRNWLKVYA